MENGLSHPAVDLEGLDLGGLGLLLRGRGGGGLGGRGGSGGQRAERGQRVAAQHGSGRSGSSSGSGSRAGSSEAEHGKGRGGRRRGEGGDALFVFFVGGILSSPSSAVILSQKNKILVLVDSSTLARLLQVVVPLQWR